MRIFPAQVPGRDQAETGWITTAAPQVPPRALVLSGLALVVPLYGSLLAPEAAREYEALLWLLALIPAFLLAYYRGWRGATFALAVGMAVLAATQVTLVLAGRSLGDWPLLLMVVVAYITISLGVGHVSELLHRERARVERLAFSDELTGLPNRRQARAFLEREFAAAERGRALAVVLFDLDRFKAFNDTYGHATGDEALRLVGRVLLRETRRVDLSARYGGEEFLAVLSDTDAEGAQVFAGRIQEALRQHRLPEAPVTISGGVAEYAAGIASPDELLAAADRALYQAKDAGGNQIRRSSPPGVLRGTAGSPP